MIQDRGEHFKILPIALKSVAWGFLLSLITNLISFFLNLKWLIQVQNGVSKMADGILNI